jgi:hypothetical protein
MIKRHLEANRLPVVAVRLEDLAHWRQSEGASRRPGKRAARIRPERLARADPTVPLVLAEIGGRRFLLDGHHRLEQAVRHGRSLILAVVVRNREILIRSLQARSALSSLWWQKHAAPWLVGRGRARGRTPSGATET